ncbi:hypothetical protein [Virgisporangium aurantiacum]|uniref:Uncharacterized protein n=1 Tax=Virgisporangium aurantiacum TaxID=175570 RepID=A0A8J3Z3I2_9ACTN|nr:hypothetical protein [Virgisporangium aurantiacum]GIJ55653.1 hypothetical protein Vau01_031690 [Virgisporangium aurantiacum]
MTGQLRETLVEIGGSMPAARLTPDVWRRGRRARIRAGWLRAGAAASVIGLVVGLVVTLAPRSSAPAPQNFGDAESAVPRTVGVPWMWQATVQMDAPGPASVLYGGDTIGLRGTDWFDSEGKLAVVGRGSGKTRTLLYGGVDDITAGEDVLLSPDGRKVASPYLLEGELDSGSDEGLVVTDLTTGKSRRYTGGLKTGCCQPVAWAPDGRSLLASVLGPYKKNARTGIERPVERLALLDLDTDKVEMLGEFRPGEEIRHASAAAFMPDGQRFVVSVGNGLRMMDRSGTVLWTAGIGPNGYLAGAGAVTRDGTAIAVAELSGCLGECDTRQLATRTWTIRFLDAETGKPSAPAGRFPAVTGMAVRALGWTDDGELVLLRHTPADGTHKKKDDPEWDDTGWWETGHVTLLGLRPDGTVRTLLDPPDGVLTMDVPADLIHRSRFGGPPSTSEMFPARPIIWVVIAALWVATMIGLGLMILLARAWRRRRSARRIRPPSRVFA